MMLNVRSSVCKTATVFMIAFGWLNFAFSQPAYRTIDVKNGGTIQGTVRATGSFPQGTIPVTKDQQQCGKTKNQSSVRVGKENGLANAVVYLKGIQKGKKFDTTVTATLDQKNCEYTPHIVLVPSGGQVNIVNSDPILHNVHTYNLTEKPNPQVPGPATLFNIAFPIQGLKIPKTMDGSGKFLTLCDAGHPWMSAYMVVMEHPYHAVTDANGHFELTAVPPGTYELRVWHEGAAKVHDNTNTAFLKAVPIEQSKQVTVEAGKTATATFELAFH